MWEPLAPFGGRLGTMSGLGEIVRGIVLAGSYAWRDADLEALGPRPVLPVCGRPIIEYVLSWFEQAGAHEVVICVNSAAAASIQGVIGRRFPNLRLNYRVDGAPRGPAGCVKDAALGEGHGDATYVVADATIVPTEPLGNLLATHRASHAALTVLTYEQPRSGMVPRFQMPGGAYVFGRAALELIPQRGYFDIKETLIPRLYSRDEPVVEHRAPGAIPRVLDRETYLSVNHWMIERLAETGHAGAEYSVIGEIVAHRSARISVEAV